MSKYIDSEKLIAEIERRIEETKSMKPAFDQFWAGQISAFKGAIKIITSLQQEQPDVQNGKFVFPKYLYARSKDNKTIDMSYAPQDMTAVEYIRNDSIEQEQPEVDWKKRIEQWFDLSGISEAWEHGEWSIDDVTRTARHFYKLGLNARKE